MLGSNRLEEKVAMLELQLAEAKRKEEEAYYMLDAIMEGTLAGYWDWYITQDYEYMSPTFKQMFGYEDHEVPNHPSWWQTAIHPDDLPKVMENFTKHVETKGAHPYDNEVRYFHKNGSIVWVYCKGKVVEWDEAGNPVRMIGCHVDITKYKNRALARERMKKLKLQNEEMKQLTYVASHDLQEPLRTIQSFIDLFKKDYGNQFDAEASDYFHFISEAAFRMQNLVKGLLDYSRIGRTKEMEIVDTQKLMQNVILDLNQHILQTKAQIHYDNLPKVKGFETEISLLFQNLINNAIKFQKPNQAPVISITVSESTGAWCFSVQDNGIGIAEKHHKKIFEIFKRLNHRVNFEGTGIGLAHCKKIVDLHGGRIWLDSEELVGSTFHFTIPK